MSSQSRVDRLLSYFDPWEPGFRRRLRPLLRGGCALLAMVACFGAALLARRPTVRWVATYALAQRGHDEQALRLAQGLSEEDPDEWQYLRVQAWLLRRLGRVDEHLAIYDTAVERNPELWWPYSHRCYYTAIFVERIGPSVVEDCDRALELEPGWPSLAYERRGVARGRVGDLDGALSDLRSAMERVGRRDDTDRRRRELDDVAGWIEVLEKGGDPFGEETLEGLAPASPMSVTRPRPAHRGQGQAARLPGRPTDRAHRSTENRPPPLRPKTSGA